MKLKPIFIFSLPRSGSTLLQRILANSGQISTVSEPWILLPLLYTLKSDGIVSEYGHSFAAKAIHDFCKGFPNGRSDYLQEMRSFVLKLYGKNSKSDAKYFLDKTPRYYFIINEIIELFPDSKFIFLWRNPLAVVASFINTWGKEKWNPMLWKLDLHDGVNNLLNGYLKNNSHVHALQYEKLIQFPSDEIIKICNYLEIEYTDEMINSFNGISLDGRMGDKTGIKKYNSLSSDSLHNWKKIFNNPIRRRWAKKYLINLGQKNLDIMGYNSSELISSLSNDNMNGYHQMIFDLFRSVIYNSSYLLSSLTLKSDKRAKYLYN